MVYVEIQSLGNSLVKPIIPIGKLFYELRGREVKLVLRVQLKKKNVSVLGTDSS